jgi:hypothetical protein
VIAMKRDHTKTATILTVALLGLAGVTGCSTLDQVLPHADQVSPQKPSTSEAEQPTPTAVYKPATEHGPAQNVPVPIMPEGVNEPTPEGLKTFAEYWYKTRDYMYKTGETGPFLAVCAVEDGPWKVFADNLAQTYADGGWLVGGISEARAEQVARQSEEDQLYQALVDARYDSMKVHIADGSTLEGGELAHRALELLTVKYANGAWQVVDSRRTGLGEESSFYNRKGAGSPT